MRFDLIRNTNPINKPMHLYVAQKAQQAVESLCKDGSRKDRLVSALGHLGFVAGNEFYFATCPPEVSEALARVRELTHESDLDQISSVITTTVERIFAECGRLGAC
jgi:hypothetical protein